MRVFSSIWRFAVVQTMRGRTWCWDSSIFARDRLTGAIASHKQAIAAVPDYAEAWFNLGEAYLKKNDTRAS